MDAIDRLSATGALERLAFEQAHEPTLIGLTHVHRYEAAAALCEGRRVLDLCCGTGYGSAILARRAVRVLGIDSDPEAIAAARRATEEVRPGGGVEFELADAYEVLERRLAGEFDVIVGFEALEHLSDCERALAALRRQLDAGLRLALSLPNSRAFGERNAFHAIDFDYEGAAAALGSLPGAALVSQFHAEGSLLAMPEAGAATSAELAWPERAAPEYCNHLLAFAGFEAGELTRLAAARMMVAPAANEYMLGLERANRELHRANVRLARDRLGVADSAAAVQLMRWREDGGYLVERIALAVATPLLPAVRLARRLGARAPGPLRSRLMLLVRRLRSRGDPS